MSCYEQRKAWTGCIAYLQRLCAMNRKHLKMVNGMDLVPHLATLCSIRATLDTHLPGLTPSSVKKMASGQPVSQDVQVQCSCDISNAENVWIAKYMAWWWLIQWLIYDLIYSIIWWTGGANITAGNRFKSMFSNESIWVVPFFYIECESLLTSIKIASKHCKIRHC